MEKKVSIIVPCYNQGLYLDDALASVLAQTYINWECIIVNDGSDDNTEEVAGRWQQKDDRFKYYKTANSGVSHARNFGIRQSTGDYILPLDGDDKLSANFLSETVPVLTNKDITLVYGYTETFGVVKRAWAPYKYNYHLLLHENVICCTALYRKEDYYKTTGYNENMRQGLEDWDFWLSLLNEKSKVVKLKHITLFYRRKKISRSTEITAQKNIELRRQIVRNHQHLYDKFLPDVITLYNERYHLKKSMVLFLLKKYAKKILKRN